MTAMKNEGTAASSPREPRVTGSPDVIWLVYGELEHDDTHANCCASGEVTWCEDPQFIADVRYVRGDLAAEMVQQSVISARAQRLTRQQAMALHTMLDHYGDDPRMRCLVELLPEPLRRDFGAQRSS